MRYPLYAAILLSLPTLAQAHVTFVSNNAYAGGRYYATLNISHGCESTDGTHYDTLKVEVIIPAAFTSMTNPVRPQDSTFGSATIEKDEQGNIVKLIWTKTSAENTEDDHFYQISFRGTLPNAPFTTLEFPTKQTCANGVTQSWEGVDAPKLKIYAPRALGWNKYTAQVNFDEAAIKSYFNDAYIIWSGDAAYSSNPVTSGLIEKPLTSIPMGAEIWVKY